MRCVWWLSSPFPAYRPKSAEGKKNSSKVNMRAERVLTLRGSRSSRGASVNELKKGGERAALSRGEFELDNTVRRERAYKPQPRFSVPCHVDLFTTDVSLDRHFHQSPNAIYPYRSVIIHIDGVASWGSEW